MINRWPARSLLLLFLALSTLLSLLSKEPSLCLEPRPTSLDVPCSIFHRHFLLDLLLLASFILVLLFFALLALLRVHLDLLDDRLDLVVSLLLPILNLVPFGFDPSNLAVFL